MKKEPTEVVYKGVSYPTIDPESPIDLSIDPRRFKSVDEAQQWITRRAHWHQSELFILMGMDSAEGPSVRASVGRYIAAHPYDTGLAEVVLWKQRLARRGERTEQPEQAFVEAT